MLYDPVKGIFAGARIGQTVKIYLVIKFLSYMLLKESRTFFEGIICRFIFILCNKILLTKILS